ncbi:MAG: hypothetical protein ACLS36_01365 [Streptococcus sp.]
MGESSILTRLNSWVLSSLKRWVYLWNTLKKTKTGYSTAVDVLERLAPIVQSAKILVPSNHQASVYLCLRASGLYP